MGDSINAKWAEDAVQVIDRAIASHNETTDAEKVSIVWGHPGKTLAENVREYIKKRSAVGGVAFDLPLSFFTDAIGMGAGLIFGVDHDGEKMLSDAQEPTPGFFAENANGIDPTDARQFGLIDFDDNEVELAISPPRPGLPADCRLTVFLHLPFLFNTLGAIRVGRNCSPFVVRDNDRIELVCVDTCLFIDGMTAPILMEAIADLIASSDILERRE